jgi:hypothetical protein
MPNYALALFLVLGHVLLPMAGENKKQKLSI